MTAFLAESHDGVERALEDMARVNRELTHISSGSRPANRTEGSLNWYVQEFKVPWETDGKDNAAYMLACAIFNRKVSERDLLSKFMELHIPPESLAFEMNAGAAEQDAMQQGWPGFHALKGATKK